MIPSFMTKWTICFLFMLVLSACNIVYRPDLQQGNILEQPAIAQLKLGMTEEQVRYLLGSCVLQTPLQSHRSDYVYLYQPAHAKPTQYRVTLTFSHGRLRCIETAPSSLFHCRTCATMRSTLYQKERSQD